MFMYFVVSTNGVCDVRELFLQNIQFAKLKFVCHSSKNYWSNKKQNIWQHEYKYSVIWHIFVNIFVNFFWKTNFLTAWKHQNQGYYMGKIKSSFANAIRWKHNTHAYSPYNSVQNMTGCNWMFIFSRDVCVFVRML